MCSLDTFAYKVTFGRTLIYRDKKIVTIIDEVVVHFQCDINIDDDIIPNKDIHYIHNQEAIETIAYEILEKKFFKADIDFDSHLIVDKAEKLPDYVSFAVELLGNATDVKENAL